MEVTGLSFNTLLLLERVQLSWFPGWVPEPELALALDANPAVEWYLRNKCPELNGWLDGVMAAAPAAPAGPDETRIAEQAVLRAIDDLVVYAVDPAVYDARPFLGWDSVELTGLVDFASQTVIDVGAGTGRLAFVAAKAGAAAVFAVEPVENLRRYMREKATTFGVRNLFAVDGLITRIPFPDGFADVTMGGHVFGDEPEAEVQELLRVTRASGMVVLCPGNGDRDNEAHRALVSYGFEWSRFEEPRDGTKRKYWRRR
jgi:SAM-dependent methyltransferase